MRRRWALAAVALAMASAAFAPPSEGPPPTAPAPAASSSPAEKPAAPPTAAAEPAKPKLAAPTPAPTAPGKQEPAPFRLWEILASAVITGCVTALAAPMIRDHLTQRRDAKISGLRLALLLEDHATRCADVYTKVHANPGYGFDDPPPKTFAPLADYPADTAWKALGYTLTEAVLTFRAEWDATVAALPAPDDKRVTKSVNRYVLLTYGSLDAAKKALAVADQLRAKLGLPPATALNDGYVRETIERAIAAANAEPESEAEGDDRPADTAAHPNGRS